MQHLSYGRTVPCWCRHPQGCKSPIVAQPGYTHSMIASLRLKRTICIMQVSMATPPKIILKTSNFKIFSLVFASTYFQSAPPPPRGVSLQHKLTCDVLQDTRITPVGFAVLCCQPSATTAGRWLPGMRTVAQVTCQDIFKFG